jgi:DNA repair exonuclease SbcCD ATPase subunit
MTSYDMLPSDVIIEREKLEELRAENERLREGLNRAHVAATETIAEMRAELDRQTARAVEYETHWHNACDVGRRLEAGLAEAHWIREELAKRLEKADAEVERLRADIDTVNDDNRRLLDENKRLSASMAALLVANIPEHIQAEVEAMGAKLAAANALLERAREALGHHAPTNLLQDIDAHLAAQPATAPGITAANYALNFCSMCGTRLDCEECKEADARPLTEDEAARFERDEAAYYAQPATAHTPARKSIDTVQGQTLSTCSLADLEVLKSMDAVPTIDLQDVVAFRFPSHAGRALRDACRAELARRRETP